MAMTLRCVAGDRHVGWLSSQVLMCPFLSSATGKAPQYPQRSFSQVTALSWWPLLIVLLATPRSQYWRYSEQTLATSHRCRSRLSAEPESLATFTLARAVSAASWFVLAADSLAVLVKQRHAFLRARQGVVPAIGLLPVPGRAMLLAALFSVSAHDPSGGRTDRLPKS